MILESSHVCIRCHHGKIILTGLYGGVLIEQEMYSFCPNGMWQLLMTGIS